MSTKKLTVIDCFCGAGGLSLGFKQSGYKILYAFDNDKTSIETYRQNLGDHAYVTDMYKITKNSVAQIIGDRINQVDVIAGGPPCQGFSVQRRGSDTDKRNKLVPEFIRFVLEVRPKFFVMENVGGLLSVRGKKFMNELHRRCLDAGYFIHVKKLNAFDYGVPQLRLRVFLVGELLTEKLSNFEFPKPLKTKLTPATVKQAIGDLEYKKAEEIPNHSADKLSPINLERIRALKEGQSRESLPLRLQLTCHKNNKSHRHLDVYGRMEWEKPSPTITARFDSFSRGRFGHPRQDRTITLREGARLQSFPDSFLFKGTKVEVARQIGNAVPPLLAKAVARAISKSLEQPSAKENFVDSSELVLA